MRTVVVGAQGQLGNAIVHHFSSSHDVVPLDRAALDVTRPDDVSALMARLRPDVIINCVAYNAVDAAEDHPLEALQANAFAVRSLARAARAANAALVHYSTDFVFDGTAVTPYNESDRPNPRSTYAASKLLGEWFAEDAPRAYVLRVESLFGRAPGGRPAKGSVESIVENLLAGRSQKVFADRTITPTSVADAAQATRQLLERQAPAGLYHCVNSGACTWVDLAREAARLLSVEARVEEVRMADVKLRAARPLFCVLSNAKLAAAGVVMPTWQDALARYLESRVANTQSA
jgi:dTDP-4-dehydrorhamnose reductase